VANIIGVPFGTWLGQNYGWRTTFYAVSAIGVVALAVIAFLVPTEKEKPEASDWRTDIKALMRPAVLIGLLTTVLGYAGVFAIFTYIAPALKDITGFSDAAVSPILLVFGGGLVIGNLFGGRLADKNLKLALFSTLIALTLVLAVMTFALESRIAAVIFIGLLGAAGFATVAPLQTWVLQKADGAGQSLASSFNIAAFNLGNALGAWIGGAVIEHGPGLFYLPLVAALFPLSALIALMAGLSLETRRPTLSAQH